MADTSDKAGTYLLGGLVVGALFMVALHGLPAVLTAPSTCTENCDDLIAQQSMAVAAWGMLAIAALSLVIGFLTLRLIRENLEEARKVTAAALQSAEAATASVEVTRAASESAGELAMAQIQAYLSVTGVTVSYEEWTASVTVYYANAGQSPARIVRTNADVAILTAAHLPFDEDGWTLLFEKAMHPAYRPDIPSGARDDVSMIAIAHDLDDSMIAAYVMFRVTGTLTFFDVFGRRQTTDFAFDRTVQRDKLVGVELYRTPIPYGQSK